MDRAPVMLPRSRSRRAAQLLAVSLLLPGCGPESGEPPPETGDPEPVITARLLRTVTEAGFATPASAIHDREADLYLVSNINGGGTEEEGDGFISRVTPGGEVEAPRWIQGGVTGVALNAPRGLALLADTLLVADLRCIRRFHRRTGEPVGELCLENAGLLADVAVDSRGNVYFSDMGLGESGGAVYLLRRFADVPQKLALADGTVLGEIDPGAPGALAADQGGLVVAGRGSGVVWRVTPRGERTQLVPPGTLRPRGIVSLGERGLLVSSEGEYAVVWVDSQGRVNPVMERLESPGDIGFDADRNRLLVPLSGSDELRIVQVR